ncbi:hypothetical protein L2E82_36378 [Cichorium intybus]|uniref:Uncharacterized protein n=1 Tax=Cichorium intybus TaxID=13427 RepID=A0ACB9BRF9_CICIN|nr:hypothetical protein L2E82_36378 [Cichorium intybus]
MFPLPPISQSIVSLYSASGSAIRFCYCNPPPVIPHPPFHLLSKASLLLQSAIVDCRRKSRQLYAVDPVVPSMVNLTLGSTLSTQSMRVTDCPLSKEFGPLVHIHFLESSKHKHIRIQGLLKAGISRNVDSWFSC